MVSAFKEFFIIVVLFLFENYPPGEGQLSNNDNEPLDCRSSIWLFLRSVYHYSHKRSCDR